ncbi:MAG: DUF3375 family protein [Gemmatimonadota bacterium]
MPAMDHDYLANLRRNHPAWRLLAADNAAWVIGFLHHCFIRTNVRALSSHVANSQLDDYLYHLRERLGDEAPSRPASEYLADWADNTRGWLRRYYPAESDEPYFDLTPSAERAQACNPAVRKRLAWRPTSARSGPVRLRISWSWIGTRLPATLRRASRSPTTVDFRIDNS